MPRLMPPIRRHVSVTLTLYPILDRENQTMADTRTEVTPEGFTLTGVDQFRTSDEYGRYLREQVILGNVTPADALKASRGWKEPAGPRRRLFEVCKSESGYINVVTQYGGCVSGMVSAFDELLPATGEHRDALRAMFEGASLEELTLKAKTGKKKPYTAYGFLVSCPVLDGDGDPTYDEDTGDQIMADKFVLFSRGAESAGHANIRRPLLIPDPPADAPEE